LFIGLFGKGLADWPTVFAVGLLPKKRMVEQLGDDYLAYRLQVLMFIPYSGGWRQLVQRRQRRLNIVNAICIPEAFSIGGKEFLDLRRSRRQIDGKQAAVFHLDHAIVRRRAVRSRRDPAPLCGRVDTEPIRP
jgi:hypothetical protein